MSRSRKKNPGHTWCGCSQKRGKQFCNRRFRSNEHRLIQKNDFLSLPLRTRELTNQYDLGGDGKGFYSLNRKNRWISQIDEEDALELYRKILRK